MSCFFFVIRKKGLLIIWKLLSVFFFIRINIKLFFGISFFNKKFLAVILYYKNKFNRFDREVGIFFRLYFSEEYCLLLVLKGGWKMEVKVV